MFASFAYSIQSFECEYTLFGVLQCKLIHYCSRVCYSVASMCNIRMYCG